mgnify:CR=1 FL=1
MKKQIRLFLLLHVILVSRFYAQTPEGEVFLKQMHEALYKGPCACYTFSQKNSHYQNDSLIRTSEWHEAIEFPDKFKIAFNGKNGDNFVLFRNDSLYRFKQNRCVLSKRDSSILLLILGGMYYRDFKDVLTRLNKNKFNTSVLSHQSWKSQAVVVIGARVGETEANQIWIDEKTYKVLRIIEKLSDQDIMDMRFEAHDPWCKGFVETKVSFRRNGKLEQVEEYYDIKECKTFPQ